MPHKWNQFKRLVVAIWHRENRGHISDLWGEFTGRLIICGKPPRQYLMLRSELEQRARLNERLKGRKPLPDADPPGIPHLREN